MNLNRARAIGEDFLEAEESTEAANAMYFDCWKCGDGSALREDESCAYCGRDTTEVEDA